MTIGLNSRTANGGSVKREGNRWLLSIPEGPALQYRLAQLEDYTGLARRDFPAHPSRTLSLRARVQGSAYAGTWGFGFWNDPYGPSLNPPRLLPALPNAAWFFHAAPQNYLSLRDDQPASGFLAQTFRAPRFDARLFLAGLTFPFSRRATRRWLSRVIAEHGTALSVDPAQWHAYSLRWDAERVVFEVDQELVLESAISPHPPLGMVIWIDNQYAAFTPEGKLGFGLLKSEGAARLEIEDLAT